MKTIKVFFPDGKFHCVVLEIRGWREFIVRNVCSACGYKRAIKWNPYNKITQCHNCGQAYINGIEEVQFT